MAVVKAKSSDVDLLARLIRAEAEGEGDRGMLLVGNVVVNRSIANCLDFRNQRNINDVVFQSPGGFEATQFGYFYQKARDRDRRLARRAIRGERTYPASDSLWYFRPTGSCPSQWYNQPFTGKYKSHCFFTPRLENCKGLFSTR
ncbi:MAG: cell wall hydrolase [Gorillibacterium sp.]|nr:cell wall hydrolase [Gorillibacterium sp.]